MRDINLVMLGWCIAFAINGAIEGKFLFAAIIFGLGCIHVALIKAFGEIDAR